MNEYQNPDTEPEANNEESNDSQSGVQFEWSSDDDANFTVGSVSFSPPPPPDPPNPPFGEKATEMIQLRNAVKAMLKSVQSNLMHPSYEGAGDMIVSAYQRLQNKAKEILSDDYYVTEVLALDISPDASERERITQVHFALSQLYEYLGEALHQERRKARDEFADLRVLGRDIQDRILNITRSTIKRAVSNIDVDFDFDTGDGVRMSGADLHDSDFQDQDLSGANFSGSNLHNANFNHATLQDASFSGAYLESASFVGANLEGASMKGIHGTNVNCHGAVMVGVNLKGANIPHINMQEVNLENANLKGVSAEGINLIGAVLENVNLKGANLANAEMQGVNLGDANLVGANLQDTDLGNAVLERANLKAANLHGCDLTSANFEYANLMHANIHDADITGATFEGARMPDGQIYHPGMNLQVYGAKRKNVI